MDFGPETAFSSPYSSCDGVMDSPSFSPSVIWNGEFWRRQNGSHLVVLTLQTHRFAWHLLERVMGGCGPAMTGCGCGLGVALMLSNVKFQTFGNEHVKPFLEKTTRYNTEPAIALCM